MAKKDIVIAKRVVESDFVLVVNGDRASRTN